MRTTTFTSLLLLGLCASQTATASTVATWVGSQPGCPNCYGVGANWDINVVPNGDYRVQIPGTGTAPVQPILSSGVTIDSLILASTASLNISNGVALGINTANTGGVSSISNAGQLRHHPRQPEYRSHFGRRHRQHGIAGGYQRRHPGAERQQHH